MWVINNRKILYTFSSLLVILAIISLAVWGLKPGIDFAGGTLIEASYPVVATSTPNQIAIMNAVIPFDPAVSVRPAGTNSSTIGTVSYIIRMKAIDQTEKLAVIDALSIGHTITPTITSFDSIGPVLGGEALRTAIVSIILVVLAIVLYITFAFRKVSQPVSSWKYGLTAIVALAHDIIIPVGAFSILGHFLGYEVDTLFVTALLVILGFSVHDTIVVFDRVRENLKHTNISSGSNSSEQFGKIVGESINQTFTRSINTSLTTLIALIILYIFGGSATEHFSLALIIGIAAGTYSSIFIGSPLLVTIAGWGKGR